MGKIILLMFLLVGVTIFSDSIDLFVNNRLEYSISEQMSNGEHLLDLKLKSGLRTDNFSLAGIVYIPFEYTGDNKSDLGENSYISGLLEIKAGLMKMGYEYRFLHDNIDEQIIFIELDIVL